MTPLFHEKQYYHPAIYWLMLVTIGVSSGPLLGAARTGKPIPTSVWPAYIIMWAVLGLVFIFLFRQRITVLPGVVEISFGFVEIWRKSFDLSHVEKLEAVQFNPLMDFGGWGIKRGRGGVWCYNVRGGTGVRLEGAKINAIIGTPYPAELLAALRAAKGATESQT